MNNTIPSKTEGIIARSSEAWVRQGIIYEIFPRSFSTSGDFDGIINALPSLKALGVSILWIMPVHPIGSIRRKGRFGSPYSVHDHYRIHDDLGTLTTFKRLIEECHKNQLRIIIDLVIGHTAWDNELHLQHPEWYQRTTSGEFLSPDPEWTDVAALEYSDPSLVHYMIDLMVHWVETIGVDGFRCDDAGRIPLHFWELARTRLDQHRRILMLAESDNVPLHHRKAFDLSYGTDFYLALKNVLTGKAPASLLHTVITQEQETYPLGSLLLRFTSNHDTNNLEGSDIQLFGVHGAQLAAVVNNTIPGVPLLYNGQEYGNQRRLDLFDAIKIPHEITQDVYHLYQRLFFLRTHYPALRDGDYVHLSTSDDEHCFAFCRVLNGNGILIVTNFGTFGQTLTITLTDERMGNALPQQYTDLLTGRTVFFPILDGASFRVSLDPYGYKVLSFGGQQ